MYIDIQIDNTKTLLDIYIYIYNTELMKSKERKERKSEEEINK